MKSVFQDFNRCVIIWLSRKSQLRHLVVKKFRKNYKITKIRLNCPVMAGIGRTMDTFIFFFFWQFFFFIKFWVVAYRSMCNCLVVTDVAIKTFGGFALSWKNLKKKQHVPSPNYSRAVIGLKDTRELFQYIIGFFSRYGRVGLNGHSGSDEPLNFLVCFAFFCNFSLY